MLVNECLFCNFAAKVIKKMNTAIFSAKKNE